MLLWSKVVVAIIPAGIIGLLFEERIEAVLHKPLPVAAALIVGAIMLLFIENKEKEIKVFHEDDITYKQALLVGCAQCMAIIPGMSRSASTIIGAMLLGFSRSVAAEFSFKLLKAGFGFSGFEYILLGIGTVVSFIVAYGVIAVFMNFIKKHDFKPFAYYRIALGLVVIIFTFI